MMKTLFDRSLLSRAPICLVHYGLLLAATLAGCGPTDSAPTAVPKRTGSVVVDGCALDSGQQSTLYGEPARQVLSQVILLCPTVQDSGAVGFRDGFSKAALSTEINDLRAHGYKVAVGITAVDGQDQNLPAAHLAGLLQDPAWRATTVQSLTDLATLADGLELALPPTTDAARADLSSLVSALSAKVRPGKTLGVFVPPSVSSPSDIEGGNAYDVAALAAQVDRLRLMTEDYSCCTTGLAPGPTIDAPWALDAAQLALKQAPASQLDIAMPLYGTNFTIGQVGQIDHSFVNYDEAVALAAQYRSAISRGAGDSPRFGYVDGAGATHQVYYQDSRFTLRTLAALPATSLPLAVGVVYYALGAEDPTLWATIAQAQQ
jgi:spore germination protein YaaH